MRGHSRCVGGSGRVAEDVLRQPPGMPGVRGASFRFHRSVDGTVPRRRARRVQPHRSRLHRGPCRQPWKTFTLGTLHCRRSFDTPQLQETPQKSVHADVLCTSCCEAGFPGGLGVHQAAALVLARRLLGCSERIPRRRAVPTGNGGHVAFRVPVRKHVRSYWGGVLGQLRPALAAHHRLGRCRDGANPIRAFVRALARGDGLGGDPFGGSRERFPDGVALHGWGDGAAKTASSEMVGICD